MNVCNILARIDDFEEHTTTTASEIKGKFLNVLVKENFHTFLFSTHTAYYDYRLTSGLKHATTADVKV